MVIHPASLLAQDWRERHPDQARTHWPVLTQHQHGRWCIDRVEPIPASELARNANRPRTPTTSPLRRLGQPGLLTTIRQSLATLAGLRPHAKGKDTVA